MAYSCSDNSVKKEECNVIEGTFAGITVKTTTCVCTGNLCNSAATFQLNFILAFSLLFVLAVGLPL